MKKLQLVIFTLTLFFIVGCGKQDKEALLFDAVDNRDIKKVETLLNQGLDIESRNPQGYTPLIIAANHGDSKLVDFLIEKGANVNASRNNGENALMAAINPDNNVEIMKMLLNSGANIAGNEGVLVLNRAVSLCEYEAVNLLIQYGVKVNDSPTTIRTAIHRGLRMVKFIVGKGADINIRDKNGITPLIEASRFGYINIVEFLLSCGAKVNRKDIATVKFLFSQGWETDDGIKLYIKYVSIETQSEILRFLNESKQ